MKSYTYRVIIEEDGKYFHGYVPALLGCHTFGKTMEDTRKNLREAIELYLESLIKIKEKIPEDRGIETFETIMMSVRKSYA
ncbi:MAG: type II toxin-antitoxin system HicB family antitoxin [bacterium]